MREATAKAIFWAGTLLSAALFLALTYDTHRQIQVLSHADRLTEPVVAGKRAFEKYNCNDCHTILGFGAYYGGRRRVEGGAGERLNGIAEGGHSGAFRGGARSRRLRCRVRALRRRARGMRPRFRELTRSACGISPVSRGMRDLSPGMSHLSRG